jgi:hypothetical protein
VHLSFFIKGKTIAILIDYNEPLHLMDFLKIPSTVSGGKLSKAKNVKDDAQSQRDGGFTVAAWYFDPSRSSSSGKKHSQ